MHRRPLDLVRADCGSGGARYANGFALLRLFRRVGWGVVGAPRPGVTATGHTYDDIGHRTRGLVYHVGPYFVMCGQT